MSLLYIEKTWSTDKGVPTLVHVVNSVRSTRNNQGRMLHVALVQSWSTVQSMATDQPPIESRQIPVAPDSEAVYGDGIFDWATNKLTTDQDSPLAGGLIMVVQVGTQTLQAAKDLKRKQINSARLAANQRWFTFQGKQIACDPLSRSDIDGVTAEVALTGQLPSDFPGAWKTVDNSFVLIPDVATWTQFLRAMVAQGAANFMRSEALKALINAAETVEALNSIRWDMVLPAPPAPAPAPEPPAPTPPAPAPGE